MNALEEGTVAEVDFEKIRRAAKSPQGLIPVVLQHAETKDVLFVGYANDLALQETLSSAKAVLWSASRDELWRKGATSGDELELVDVRVNCEQNALLYLVRPVRGGVCHTTDAKGATRATCFYRRVPEPTSLEFIPGFGPAA
ncbi:MAG TPA: phosphoribosyl-AMP cyclohydrolase [Acidimicrobiales bacterium]|nr:phosphoribosyl-AMP cyclohydrolase [Acidimicrobiales bacterium]